MDIKEILSFCDHTLLKPDASAEEIKAVCQEAIDYGTASVCIPAAYVKPMRKHFGEKLNICTVIGFPNGYSTTEAKCFEATDAVKNGAAEIDMVINVGDLKSGNYKEILNEINAVHSACCGRLLKVIIETCLLTEEEIIKMCEIVSESQAEYIKTSTGFSTGGATKADVHLMAQHVYGGTKIKAAGGIKTLADAEEFIKLGASRLGTSSIVKLAKEQM